LTIAHHDRRLSFSREDLVEAMTTVESGTAIGIDYVPEETRAVAIHEAGHAAAAHVYKQGAESTRLSIRMRGGSLGHHMALERDEPYGDGLVGLLERSNLRRPEIDYLDEASWPAQ